MHRVLLTTGLCLFLATMASSSNRLVCYYDRKSSLRPSLGQFTPADIDPHLCTHIIFSYAAVDQQNLVPVAPSDTDLYTQLNNLKSRNPNLKTLLAVGGPDANSQTFSSMVSAANKRQAFIASAKALIQTYSFDGINLDWRYPGSTDSQPQDKNRFLNLCEEFKTAFAANSLILSASVSAVKTIIDASYPDPIALANALDFLNVLTFDFHSSSEMFTAHHSPLGALSTNPADTLTTQYAMNYWTTKGVPAAKLNMGIAAYGIAFRLADANNNGVGAPTSTLSPEAGCYGVVPGFWSYYENCLYTQGGTEHWIPSQSVPYAVTQGQWVGYDNTASIDAKTSHITANGYGGATVWSVDLDDYTGQFCGAGSFPFIRYLRSKLPGVAATFPTTTPILMTTPTSTTTTPTSTTTTPTTTPILTTTPTTTTTTPTSTTTTTTPTTTPILTTTPTTTTTTPTTTTTTTTPTTTPTTTVTTTTTPPPSGTGNACNGQSGIFANPDDIYTFYNCDHGRANLLTCPSGLRFCDSCKCCSSC